MAGGRKSGYEETRDTVTEIDSSWHVENYTSRAELKLSLPPRVFFPFLVSPLQIHAQKWQHNSAGTQGLS